MPSKNCVSIPTPRRYGISRRSLLGLVAAAAVPLRAAEERRKIVICGGHPGDPEYGCGGAAARFAGQGHDVVLLYLNRGEKTCPPGPVTAPSDDASRTRTAEAAAACKILNARPLFAPQCDGQAVVDPRRYQEFHDLIAAERPDAVFTQWPIDGHADHRAISALAYNAWLAAKKQYAFYYYEVSDGEDTLMFQPTDYVDITAVEPRKRQACYAHASQSPGRFYPLQQQVTKFRGVESGYKEAEAFIRHAQSPRFPFPGR